jgi:hypothetical protein
MNKYTLYFSHIDRQKPVGSAPIPIGSEKTNNKNSIHIGNIPAQHSVLSLRDGELIMQFVDSAAKCWINDKEIVTDTNGYITLKINDKVAIRDKKKTTFTVEKYDERTKRKSLAPLDLQTPLKSNENPKYSEKEDEKIKPISLDLNKALKSNPEDTKDTKKSLPMEFSQSSDEENENNNHKTKTEPNKNLPKKEINAKRPVEENETSSEEEEEKTKIKNPPPKVLPKKEIIISKPPVEDAETSSSSHEKTKIKNPPPKVLPKKEIIISKPPVEEAETSSSSHEKTTTKNPPKVLPKKEISSKPSVQDPESSSSSSHEKTTTKNPSKVLPKKEIIEPISQPKKKEEKNLKFTHTDSADKQIPITKKLNTSDSSSSEEAPKKPKNTKKLPNKEIIFENPKPKENPTQDIKQQKSTKPDIQQKKILQEIVPPQPRAKSRKESPEQSPEQSPVKPRPKKRTLPQRKAKKPPVKSKYDFISESSKSENEDSIQESKSDNENRRSDGDSDSSEVVPYAFKAALRSNNMEKNKKKIPYQDEDRLRRHVRYNVPILKKGGYEQLDYYKGKKYI